MLAFPTLFSPREYAKYIYKSTGFVSPSREIDVLNGRPLKLPLYTICPVTVSLSFTELAVISDQEYPEPAAPVQRFPVNLIWEKINGFIFFSIGEEPSKPV